MGTDQQADGRVLASETETGLVLDSSLQTTVGSNLVSEGGRVCLLMERDEICTFVLFIARL